MRYYFSLIIVLLFTSCNKEPNERKKASDFILANTERVYHIGSLETYNSTLNSNETFKNLFNIKDVSTILNNLNANEEVIVSQQDSSSFTLITKIPDSSFFKIDSIYDKTDDILEFSIEDTEFFTIAIDSFLIISPNKKNIKEIVNNKHVNDTFFKSNNNSTINIHLKLKDSTSKDSFDLFGNSLNLDVNASENSISFNGISKITDSTTTLLTNQRPKEHVLLDVIPEKSNNITSFAIQNLTNVLSNLDTTTLNEELFDLISDIAKFKLNNTCYIFNTLDVESTKTILFGGNSKSVKYRDVKITSLQNNHHIRHIFAPFSLNENDWYSFNIKNAFVFTQSVEDAKEIINDYKNDKSFKNSSFYESIKEAINDESSFLYLNNDNTIDPYINHYFSSIFSKELSATDLKKFNNQVLQITTDNGFFYINGFIKTYKVKAKQNSVSEEFLATLDADILNTPQFVKNHVTKQKDIVIQDIENNLYVFSNTGKLRWKKELQGPVLGAIEQIDIYKNGRLQMVFATPNRIYVIDRNGKDVSPFPKKFADNITQPLSVFDYDNTKTYRLLVTQGQNTIMYDSKGKQVKGFTFKSADNTIISQPKHYRTSNKDYIVFKTKNKLHILNRRGQTRIKTKSNFNFSNNAIYFYKNRFTTTSSSGELIQIDTRGKQTSQNLFLNESHAICSTSKTLVSLNDNMLTIRGKRLELDFGDYTKPKIFYLNDKIYVSVTDLQTQKVYLFDSQAKFISNFPIYGNSSIDLSNIDSDKSLELVTKTDSNSLVIYKLN